MSGYLFLTLLYVAFRYFDSSPANIHALAGNFIHLWLWHISTTLLLLSILVRQLDGLVGLCGCVVGFFMLFGVLYWPHPEPTCDDSSCVEFTVMTYNASALTDPETAYITLRDSGADIIVVQELQASQGEIFQQNLSDVYPYQALYMPDISDGIGILSYYPINDSETFRLSDEGFSYIKAEIAINDETFTVIGVYAPPPHQIPYRSWFRAELPYLLDIATEDPNTILFGDFNTTDQTDDYQTIVNAGFKDAWREAGWGLGLTLPANNRLGRFRSPKLVRIDYVFYTEAFAANEVWMGPPTGSDHLPVLARLVFTPE